MLIVTSHHSAMQMSMSVLKEYTAAILLTQSVLILLDLTGVPVLVVSVLMMMEVGNVLVSPCSQDVVVGTGVYVGGGGVFVGCVRVCACVCVEGLFVGCVCVCVILLLCVLLYT